MTTILIVEDEPELVKVLRSYLEKAGYQVISALRGDSGLDLFDREQPDMVLLDINLPGLDGLSVAREIRQRGNTPMLMLTARVEEVDRLIGLELGADDYITKPYSPREVVARVRAVLRRSGTISAAPRQLQVGNLFADLDEHIIRRDGQTLELTPTEFNYLVTLLSQPGRAFSRLQLLEATQGLAYEGYERTVDAHIKNLRAKIELDPRRPVYIETVFGVGYRLRKE